MLKEQANFCLLFFLFTFGLLFNKPNRKKAKYIFAGFGLEYDKYTLAGLETFIDNPSTSLPLSRALGHLEFSDDEIKESQEEIVVLSTPEPVQDAPKNKVLNYFKSSD